MVEIGPFHLFLIPFKRFSYLKIVDYGFTITANKRVFFLLTFYLKTMHVVYSTFIILINVKWNRGFENLCDFFLFRFPLNLCEQIFLYLEKVRVVRDDALLSLYSRESWKLIFDLFLDLRIFTSISHWKRISFLKWEIESESLF